VKARTHLFWKLLLGFFVACEDSLRHWLVPVGGVFICLSLVAAAMVVLGFANVRIDVRIQRTDGTRRARHHDGERD
jgi:hypothetical protein